MHVMQQLNLTVLLYCFFIECHIWKSSRTLSLRISERTSFIDGAHLDNSHPTYTYKIIQTIFCQYSLDCREGPMK
jgi:hypothetical protein